MPFTQDERKMLLDLLAEHLVVAGPTATHEKVELVNSISIKIVEQWPSLLSQRMVAFDDNQLHDIRDAVEYYALILAEHQRGGRLNEQGQAQLVRLHGLIEHISD